ncbi:chemotaxis response regulator CheB [Rhodopirellula rubra]|uniref:protein-glutamate methylesterase n=1 Tax=Aporhodopirellula rubra TaxID=980271 RepID=A0A7W5E2Y5_9BACT|nr:chemotaxis protein CheB [Aporhodopirellula rubra]MBB3209236.1 chemotaxis response regulator CheB [Aporhodopirellula rubra]
MTTNDSPSSNTSLIVAIGASAGGFKEIVTIVEGLPCWFAGTLIIATHREPKHENVLADILARRARIRVDEPEDEECLECTTIYVGHSDETVEVDGDEFDVEVDTSRYARMHRIDDLFKSVAESAGRNAVGVILSGMLSDGTEGMRAIKSAGGRCIIQSPSDADCPSMPLHALAEVDPVFVGTAAEIASFLMELALDETCH